MDAARARIRLLIGVSTLEYLRARRADRRDPHGCSATRSGCKPLLTMRDGEVVEYKTVRGVAGRLA